MAFQEYFVHQECQPRVKGFRFAGIETARPAPGVREAIEQAEAVVICPSNPWVSIDPILAVVNLTPTPSRLRRVVAVSPIIGGQTVKGPAAKMFAELGIQPSALAVARHYGNLLTGFVLDSADAAMLGNIENLGMRAYATNTLMKTPADRRRLAENVLNFIAEA
jgi:LPPG:FO 2-phospho-L-lactate transferase